MSSSSPLERTIDKVLTQKESELISKIDSAYQESRRNLDSSKSNLNSEYMAIIENAKKQAENLKRQIGGSSKLSARNNQLILVEDSVKTVFDMARKRLLSIHKELDYERLIKNALLNSLAEIGKNDLFIECNKTDSNMIRKVVEDINEEKGTKMVVADKNIDILGGIRATSSDGTLTFDDSIDSRIERLKPLIRKNIVQILRGSERESWSQKAE
ncbi:MAG TPA: V-type ATP synthase subunit E family protein [Nitrososphaeraceae archaeon]|nr:V-type ATP synthase subunit E family protein [Nitrososphaeraceae archaeon]